MRDKPVHVLVRKVYHISAKMAALVGRAVAGLWVGARTYGAIKSYSYGVKKLRLVAWLVREKWAAFLLRIIVELRAPAAPGVSRLRGDVVHAGLLEWPGVHPAQTVVGFEDQAGEADDEVVEERVVLHGLWVK